jgi:uncharacterized protein YecE (DUF72 family)
MPELRIGCSGFNYWYWKGRFYPDDLPQNKWLEYYSNFFNTVELNVTFYRLPLQKTFDKWYKETPDDFLFSLKGSKFITHVKRLIEPEEPLKLFFERSLRMKKKFAVALWQFSPGFKLDFERFYRFLELLKVYNIRNTFEFRHESWIVKDVIELCGRYNMSLCMADWPEFINELPITADFVYIRRHGEGGSYSTCYSEEELRKDAKKIKKYLKEGKDVFIYFNNDYNAYAVKNAQQLKSMLKIC